MSSSKYGCSECMSPSWCAIQNGLHIVFTQRTPYSVLMAIFAEENAGLRSDRLHLLAVHCCDINKFPISRVDPTTVDFIGNVLLPRY